MIAAAIIRGQKPAKIPVKALQHKIMFLNLKAAAARNAIFPAELVEKADKAIN